MSDFSQKHSRLTTFHLVEPEGSDLAEKLKLSSRWKKAVLVIPLLATEFTHPQNRDVFLNILDQLRRVTYLSRIIFGLDNATDDEAAELVALCRQRKITNFLIQHNQGPGFTSIYHQLTEAGFRLDQPGKGKNMFLSFGVAQALGAQCVGLIDADIRTFKRRQLDRLFFPVLVSGYQFSKAFYSRLAGRRMYGRVKRLLLDPLLVALKRKFTDSKEEKVLRIIDFLLAFNYQLSGEVVFDTSLLKRMHFATNWGVEIFTLIEVYRKATNVAQVEFSVGPFDHKHQDVSFDERDRGLHKMGVDIVTTLMRALVIEEGLEISDHFMRDLTITYMDVADDFIKKYADNALFSGLDYDRNLEEATVRTVFTDALLCAGDLLTAPYRQTERFLRFVHANDVFRRHLKNGLSDDIMTAEENLRDQLFETPQTVSWERIIMKLPRIMYDLIDVIEKEKKRFE